MFSFLVKRLYQALIVMFVISLVAFAIQDNLGDRRASLWVSPYLKQSVKHCVTN